MLLEDSLTKGREQRLVGSILKFLKISHNCFVKLHFVAPLTDLLPTKLRSRSRLKTLEVARWDEIPSLLLGQFTQPLPTTPSTRMYAVFSQALVLLCTSWGHD